MTRIADLLAAGRTYSFEFFPPKTDAAQLSLGRAIAELEPLGPSFVSVTYGAGGSTRQRTREVVTWVRHETAITPMAHLTCQGHSRAEIKAILDDYREQGIDNILALGGDPPACAADTANPADPADPAAARPSDYRYASDLIDDVDAANHFSIGVAAHPEVHPRSPDRESDRDHLAAKLRRADFAITQFFFESEHYLRLMDELAARGVDKPVLPGIMPVTNTGPIMRMAAMNGTNVPAWLRERLAGVDDPAEIRRIGVDVATTMCGELLEAGAPGLHFYTLNRSTATREIYANLGLAATATGRP
jgi:methylenetetrahydrofolate reductase (NADPH)